MSTDTRYSKTSLFRRMFPPPKYLTTPAVGIDISDYAIKYVFLERHPHGVKLASYGNIDLPVDTIERGEIKDPATIVKMLSRVREEVGCGFAHLALPEEHAYLFQMQLPRGSRSEVEQMLEFHLKENVPFGASEAVFDYGVIGETAEQYEFNISVYPDAVASQYVNVVEEAGFSLISVEMEGQATARALLASNTGAPVLVIDIGRNNASLSISTNGFVSFTANLETGGDYFTRTIARALNISFQEAEKLKREHGFRDTDQSKPIFEALLPVVSDFKESINKHLMYWQMHTTSGGAAADEMSRVILVGGNANMAGLAEYLEATLDVPVDVGNVWRNIYAFEKYIPNMHATQSLKYATAVGLALRSLARSSY